MALKGIYAFLLICIALASCTNTGIIARQDGSVTPNPGKRSFGSFIDDRQIIEVVKTNFDNDGQKFSKSNINVYSFNKVVLLTGEVPTESLKIQATQIAKNVHMVRVVHNELQVRPNTSFMSRANDNWIHNKIKAKLRSDVNIDANRVEVIVENEVVYLMGLLTRREALIVTDIVRVTGGVSKVVRAFEYLD